MAIKVDMVKAYEKVEWDFFFVFLNSMVLMILLSLGLKCSLVHLCSLFF